jgi:protein-S-isoprenylcysteine O-methyltransferase Ste14
VRKPAAAAGSALFFLAAPAVVAGLVPFWISGWQVRRLPGAWGALRLLGGLVVAAALAVLVPAFVRFALEGRGTPAPVAPTERLVVGGLYRHVRNPMYLAVVGAIVGQALILGSGALGVYAAGAAAVMASFARWYEEPALRRRFGAEYEAYRRAVPAWWPRRRPWVAPAVGEKASVG